MDSGLQMAIEKYRDAHDAYALAQEIARDAHEQARRMSDESNRRDRARSAAKDALFTCAHLDKEQGCAFALPDGRALVLRDGRDPGVRYIDIFKCDTVLAIEVTDGKG